MFDYSSVFPSDFADVNYSEIWDWLDILNMKPSFLPLTIG
jgi:hypothetical protein